MMTWIIEQFEIISDIFFYLIQVLHWTVLISVCAYCVAVIFGLIFGLGRISHNKFIKAISGIYVNVFRGIPLIVLIFFFYFGLGKVVNLDRFVAGVLAIGVCYGAYMAEILRAGILAINYGQYEAAMSLGMTKWQAMRHIILPQTFRIVVPPGANEFIACLKDSSLVMIIGLKEITQAGKEYANQSFLDFHTWLVVGAIYLIMTVSLSRVVKIIEEKFTIHGYGVKK